MSNVIAFPTAAPAKVRQRVTRAAREARKGLPTIQRIAPDVRAHIEDARHIHEADGNTALALMLAILPHLEREAKLKAFMAVSISQRPECKQARAILACDLFPQREFYIRAAQDVIAKGLA